MAEKKYITNRKEAFKNSSLPYSFAYKIRNAFIGEICPMCKFEMRYFEVDEVVGVMKSIRSPSIQHNIPINLGGKHELDNISVICRSCNNTLQDTITGSLNNSKVKEKWQMLNGLK